MRRIAIVAATLAAVLAHAAPVIAQGGILGCVLAIEPDATIRACTLLIDSGRYSGKDLATAYVSRGFAYMDLGDDARAIKNFDEALRIDPKNVDAYSNRGAVFANLGETARTIQDYDAALRLDPDYAFAYFNRASALCELGQVEASVDDRTQAFRLDYYLAKDFHNDLRARDIYNGAFNPKYGLASRKALREWTAAGCP